MVLSSREIIYMKPGGVFSGRKGIKKLEIGFSGLEEKLMKHGATMVSATDRKPQQS